MIKLSINKGSVSFSDSHRAGPISSNYLCGAKKNEHVRYDESETDEMKRRRLKLYNRKVSRANYYEDRLTGAVGSTTGSAGWFTYSAESRKR
uniref:Uncharacterized protein n=1 Tax=Caenorhabditis japonica TaxID=281687 RepID=A0A8R1EQT4_CAEJA